MKGTTKVIMGATLVMVVTLAVVLGLILVLLAELYCSLLLRRRQLRKKSNSTTIPAAAATSISSATASPSPSPSHPQQHHPPHPPPFTTIYSQGVLQPPRTFLFPSTQDDISEQPKKQHHQQHHSDELHQIIQIQTEELTEISLQGSGSGREQLVYISNPIYENEEEKGKGSGVNNTPFETPDTSPSRLERSGSSSSGEDEVEGIVVTSHSPVADTPPLTPMKKLPAEACSVSLRASNSLGTSGSDSRSVNGPSSSSSGSPCTSPSW